MGRSPRRLRRTRLGRSDGRIGHPLRLPVAGLAARESVPSQRRWLPAESPRRVCVSGPRSPARTIRLMPRLDELPPGTRARIASIAGDAALVQRLMELGVLEGEEVEVVGFAPLGDPMEVRLADTRLSLRRHEAAGIAVDRIG